MYQLRRGGPRGETPWRDRPTDRQKVISERYAQYIKEETRKVVDPETIRAVRYTVLRHSERAIFDTDDELEILTAHAKYSRKRERLLKLLQDNEDHLAESLDSLESDEDDDDDPFEHQDA